MCWCCHPLIARRHSQFWLNSMSILHRCLSLDAGGCQGVERMTVYRLLSYNIHLQCSIFKFHNFIIITIQKMCHKTCLTCSASTFKDCLTCQPGLVLSSGTCSCLWWQSTCTLESNLREVFLFLDFFIILYLVGLMLLYTLRVTLPISYRIWNSLNALSFVIYSSSLYLDFQDEYILRSLAKTNGPFFPSLRIMNISSLHIYPTITVLSTCLLGVFLLYFPFKVFVKPYESYLEYLKDSFFISTDSFYFFGVKMMAVFIGKTINQSGGTSVLYIIMSSVYGVIILLFLVRFIYLYHHNRLQQSLYPAPLYLYTLLSPLALLGLPLITSSAVLLVPYTVPFGFLILIIILNKQFVIFTKKNVVFYVTQLVMIGFSVAVILVSDSVKSYILLALIFFSLLVITGEVIVVNRGGYDLSSTKVHPEEQEESVEEVKRKPIQKSGKYI